MLKVAVSALIILSAIAVGCSAPTPSQNQTSSPAPAQPPASPSAAPAKSGEVRFFTIEGIDMRDVPLLMAVDSLIAQGYDVKVTYLANSTLTAAALAHGDADLASFNVQTMWAAIAKGANDSTIMQRYVTAPLIASKQDVQTCAGLNGKSIAMASTRGSTPALLDLYIKNECPETKLQIVVIADNKARAIALQAGQVDAAQIEAENLLRLEREAPGRFRTLVALGEEFPQVLSGGIHVRRDWAGQHPETVKAFVRALLTANRQVIEKSEILYSESVKRLGLDPDAAKEAADAYLGYKIWDANGGMTAENVQYTLDFFKNIQAVPASLKLDDVADLSYLNAVLDEIGRK